MAKLTDIAIRNLKPAEARREVPDGGCTGLYLVIQPNGKKSWAVRYRVHGKSRKLTLGSIPPVSLAEARTQATAALLQVAHGTDPIHAARTAKAAARTSAEARAKDSVRQLWQGSEGDSAEAERSRKSSFLGRHVSKLRPSTQVQVRHVFEDKVLPAWGGRIVHDITRRDIIELIDSIAADHPIAANRALGWINKFFKWLAARDVITASPCVGIERPAKENVRDRALNDDEVRAFWAATDQLPAPFGDIYKLLLLSGARRQEVAELQWKEIDRTNKVWTLPAARSKSGKSHLLPLGPMAWDIIEAQPRMFGSDYVFGARRSGFAHMKPRLDEAMGVSDWVTHDLRRTARSLMSRAHIDSEVAELMIGHLQRGIKRVYNVHDYAREKRDGFASLEHLLTLILNQQEAEVVPLRR
jgi:integrase